MLSLVFLVSGHLLSQQLATLNVTVADPSGSVVSGARVTVRNSGTGAKRDELTGGTGLAVIPGLPAGNYELTVESDQFSSFKGRLTLTVGQIASVPVALGLQAVREEIQVQETVQGIDTERSEVSQVVDMQNISDLPISGRDFIDFVLLTPTANVGRSTAVGAQSPFQETVLQLSFAGLRENHNVFFGLDGIGSAMASAVRRIRPLAHRVSRRQHGKCSLQCGWTSRFVESGNISSMSTPNEPIGSIPRPAELLVAMRSAAAGTLSPERLCAAELSAVRDTIARFEQTGSPVITDGEQTKPSFAAYPLAGLKNLTPDGVVISSINQLCLLL